MIIELIRHRTLARAAIAVAVLGLATVALRSRSEASVFYVDYAHGSDDAAGTQPTAAWKHAPGDPTAGGKALAADLKPGDVVRFRGAVAYRGTVRVPASGTTDQPIVFSGDEWGPEPAVFDGSDPVASSEPCPSAEACGGASEWRRLRLVTFAPPATGETKLFDQAGPLFESQYPPVKDRMFSDQLDEYELLPLDRAAAAQRGEIRSAKLARLVQGDVGRAQLSIWVQGNTVERRPVTAVEADRILFPAAGLRLYDDRPDRYAVVGAVGLVDRPGDFAVLAPGRAVIAPRPDASVSVGSGRNGFNFGGRSHIVLRGFVFEHFFGPETAWKGLPVFNTGGVSTHLVIEKNVFRDCSLFNGAGVITLASVTDATVEKNLVADIERGSGVRTSLKPVANVRIAENQFTRLGRTAIALLGASDAVVTKNSITGLRGIHGNGISLYLDNRRVEVSDNRVTDTTRPMTFHGDDGRTSPGDHDFRIVGNTFITDDAEAGALTSYGAGTRNVTIEHNVLIGPKHALMLSPTDTGVVVRENQTTDIFIKGPRPSGWVIERNGPAKRSTATASGADTSR